MSKITRQQVAIIGSVLILVVLIVAYFAVWQPLKERQDAAQTTYDQQHAIVLTEPELKAKLAKANADVQIAKSKYARYERALMPNIDLGGDLITAMRARWKEQNSVLGPKAVNFLKQDKAVRTVASFSVPAPPTDPNQNLTQVIVIPLGQVAVTGNFREILANVARWNNFDRLVMVDGLTLTGNSPSLQAQYTVTCYIFPKNADKAAPAVPSAGGAGGFGGPGGYPGAGGFGGKPGAGGAPID